MHEKDKMLYFWHKNVHIFAVFDHKNRYESVYFCTSGVEMATFCAVLEEMLKLAYFGWFCIYRAIQLSDLYFLHERCRGKYFFGTKCVRSR